MPIADLHIHLTGKGFLTHENIEEMTDIDQMINVRLPFGLDNLLGDRLDSQSNLVQLEDGEVKLVITSLYAFELPLENLLKLPVQTDLARTIPKSIFEALVSGNLSPYNNLLQREIEFFKFQMTKFNGRIRHFRNLGDFHEGEVNVLINIEGAHALLDKSYPPGGRALTPEEENKTVENLIALKKRKDIRIFMMNLCHFANNPFCTHAFGMPNAKDKFEDFIATLYTGQKPGLSSLGKRIISASFRKMDEAGNIEPRILIDFKHLSLYSRLDYYKYMKDNHPDCPLVYTHSAPAGVTIAYRINLHARYTKLAPAIGNNHFNSCSINLYDEEIAWIIQNNGYIGLSLDERILGVKKDDLPRSHFKMYQYYDPIMDEEYDATNHHPFYSTLESNWGGRHKTYTWRAAEGRSDYFEHLDHLANAIMRIVWCAGERAWNQMFISSDFDGLIDALRCCQTVSDITAMEIDLVERIIHLASKDLDTDYFLDNIELKVRNVFYNNALHFVKEQYHEIT